MELSLDLKPDYQGNTKFPNRGLPNNQEVQGLKRLETEILSFTSFSEEVCRQLYVTHVKYVSKSVFLYVSLYPDLPCSTKTSPLKGQKGRYIMIQKSAELIQSSSLIKC